MKTGFCQELCCGGASAGLYSPEDMVVGGCRVHDTASSLACSLFRWGWVSLGGGLLGVVAISSWTVGFAFVYTGRNWGGGVTLLAYSLVGGDS